MRRNIFGEKRELEKVEKEIEQLENKKKEVTNSLNSGSQDFEDLAKWGQELKSIEATLENLETRWLELSDGI